MHELSLAEDIILLVEKSARQENARRVKTVVIEIGRLSTVEPEALRFAFDVVKQGGKANDAELEIIDIPGVGICSDCNQESPMEEIYAICPHCGSTVSYTHLDVYKRQLRVRQAPRQEADELTDVCLGPQVGGLPRTEEQG